MHSYYFVLHCCSISFPRSVASNKSITFEIFEPYSIGSPNGFFNSISPSDVTIIPGYVVPNVSNGLTAVNTSPCLILSPN